MSAATRISWLAMACAIFAGVHSRNVQDYTTRSYDLDVPGSKPIRIIEADPGWDLNTKKPPPNMNRNDGVKSDRVPQALGSIRSNYKPFTHRGDKDDRFKHRPDFEHRTLKPALISNRNDRFPSGFANEEDNSERLKKFLNSYAENVKKINVQVDYSNEHNDDDQIILDDKFVDIPPEDQIDENHGKPEKSKSWNLLHFDKIQQGPQNNKGWVSMDAVPWSVSKISKWHGKPKKDKYQNQNNNGYYDPNPNTRPYNDRFHVPSQPEFPRPNYPTPMRPVGVNVGQRPNGYYDDPNDEGDIEDPVDDNYYNRRPSFPRPSATYGQKVNLHTVQSFSHQGNTNKRPYNDNCNNHQHNHHNSGPGSAGPFGHSHDDGIITDGMPANFPEHDYGNRRRGVTGDTSVSATVSSAAPHPFNGEVLPPLDDGRVNMTTSHGGLLQVDATFQSVEEAQKQHAKRQKLKVRPQRRPVRIRPQLGLLDTYSAAQKQALKQQVQYQLQNGDNVVSASSPGSSVSDSSAVLAAVGAGMIPAGMALLVPMAMSGKRRRRRQVEFPEFLTVSPYTNRVELTLPASL